MSLAASLGGVGSRRGLGSPAPSSSASVPSSLVPHTQRARHTHTHTHNLYATHGHTPIYTGTHTRTCTQTHTYTHIQTHTVHIHAPRVTSYMLHIQHTWVYMQRQTHNHAYGHTQMHTNPFTPGHAHTFTHTRELTSPGPPPWSGVHVKSVSNIQGFEGLTGLTHRGKGPRAVSQAPWLRGCGWEEDGGVPPGGRPRPAWRREEGREGWPWGQQGNGGKRPGLWLQTRDITAPGSSWRTRRLLNAATPLLCSGFGDEPLGVAPSRAGWELGEHPLPQPWGVCSPVGWSSGGTQR